MFPRDRRSLRDMYVEAWRRHGEGLPMEPLQAQVADVIADHPEYQPLLEGDEEALERDWTPGDGETNPFLHMGMHLAIREQVATDRPPGIAGIHRRLAGRLGDAHAAEHAMMECLGEALWRARRDGHPPDEAAYLEALRRLAA